MQRLHNRNTTRLARAVDGGRNHQKRIVDVHNVRILPRKELREFTFRVVGPNAALHESQPFQTVKLFDLVVAPAIRNHLVAGLFQHPFLMLEDNVLTTGDLVIVMYQQDFQGGSRPKRQRFPLLGFRA